MTKDRVTEILAARNSPDIALTLQEKKKRIAQIEEYDFQENLIPTAWLERKPPANIPPDAIWLFHYFESVGKELFSDWAGNELYARSPDQITANLTTFHEHQAEQSVRQAVAEADGKKYRPTNTFLSGPKGYTAASNDRQIFKTRSEEIEAFSRKELAIKKIIDDLNSYRISGFMLTASGERIEISSKKEGPYLSLLELTFDIGGPTYIDHTFQDRFIENYKQPPGPHNEGKIWIVGALYLLLKKKQGMGYRQAITHKLIAENAARDLIKELQKNPQITVFKIRASNGKTEIMERDYLGGMKCVENFREGFIPNYYHLDKPPENYIYLDEAQFDDFLNDRPIRKIIHPREESSIEKSARELKKAIAIMDDKTSETKDFPAQNKGGRPRKYNPGKYAAILAYIDFQEDTSSMSQDEICRKISEAAQNVWPEETPPEESWLEDNLVREFKNNYSQVKKKLSQ